MARRHRREHAALALPVLGAIAIVPPLLSVFNRPVTFAGIPLVAIYFFSLWIVLIAATAFLSGRMRNTADSSGSRPADDTR